MPAPTLGLAPLPTVELGVTPALVQRAELLALPAVDLAARVERELATNPALTLPTPTSCSRCGATVWAGSCAACRVTRVPAYADEPTAEDAAATFLADLARELGPGDRRIAEHVLADVDAHGLLSRDPAELAVELGVSADAVRRVVAVLAAAGPPGFCARDVRELLLCRLAARVDAPPLAERIVRDHLADLAAGRVAAVARALDVAVGEVEAARDWLRTHVRPSAGLPTGGVVPPSAPADVVAVPTAAGDRYTVELTAGPWSAVRVDPAYARALEALLDPAVRDRVAAQVAAGQEFVRRLADRARILHAVAECAVAHQSTYLRDGPAAHRPLTRADVARAVGVHESTVSRALTGKRLGLPGGRVVPFADLFGGARSVKAALRTLLDGSGRRLSDGELAAALEALGHRVARRTVAKYRAELGIAARSDR